MLKVAEGVYRVPARHANTYLVEADNGLVLVDTGMPGSENRILKAVADLGREPSDVKLILLTHRHWDNIGSAAALKKRPPEWSSRTGSESRTVRGALFE